MEGEENMPDHLATSQIFCHDLCNRIVGFAGAPVPSVRLTKGGILSGSCLFNQPYSFWKLIFPPQSFNTLSLSFILSYSFGEWKDLSETTRNNLEWSLNPLYNGLYFCFYWSPIVEHLETQSPYVHHNTHTMCTKHPITLNEIIESPAMPNRATEQLLPNIKKKT